MNPIENLLRRKIGLDAASVGSSLIERTIRLRQKTLGLATREEYLKHLDNSAQEWDDLIDAVVVTETWFFRDHEPFRAFTQLACEQLRDPTARALQILSLPCSTGEEPYSLVMALLDAGIPQTRFVLDAVDLSPRALSRARLGLYGKNSFRNHHGQHGKSLEYRQRYFTETADGYQIADTVKNCVRFHRANLLADDFFAQRAPYDFVFCRNLLIYFDRATQAQALRRLHRQLAPTGVLFVGPAEMPLVTEHGFTPAGLPMAFASRKVSGSTAKAERGGLLPARSRKTATRKLQPTPSLTPPDAPRPTKPATSNLRAQSSAPTVSPSPKGDRGTRGAKPGAPHPLEAARALADAGKLAEAASLCDAHLKSAGPDAQAYYLLGLVSDAAGDPAALDHYRKALYLEPNHYETLLQMALLLEKNGDTTGARAYKRRAERVSFKPIA